MVKTKKPPIIVWDTKVSKQFTMLDMLGTQWLFNIMEKRSPEGIDNIVIIGNNLKDRIEISYLSNSYYTIKDTGMMASRVFLKRNPFFDYLLKKFGRVAYDLYTIIIAVFPLKNIGKEV